MAGQQEREKESTNREGMEEQQSVEAEEFVRYTLAKKQIVSSTCAIFTLRPAAGAAISFHATRRRLSGLSVLSVQVKHPKLQIVRSYTPLSPIRGQGLQDLRFLIRNAQPYGEVSSYIHRLPLGSDIELRGPAVHCILPEQVHSVLLMAGGVGIAPAMQIAEHIGRDATLHILWGSRRAEECAGGISDTDLSDPVKLDPSGQRHAEIVRQLESFRDVLAGRMKINYFVDEENTFISPSDIAQILHLSEWSASRIILVSGPRGFVNYWAGPKELINGKEAQGPLGGVMSTLDLRGWQVIKL